MSVGAARLKNIINRPLTPVVLLALVAFVPLLFGDLVARDIEVIRNEPVLMEHGSSTEVFTRSSPVHDPLHRYRPVATASMATDISMAGRHAAWLRLTHIVLLLAVGYILFSLLRQLGISERPAAWAVAIFLVHPTHIEVIATLAGRAPLAANLFGATAVLMTLRLRPSRATSLAGFLLMLLAVLSMRSAFLWLFFSAMCAWAGCNRIGQGKLLARPLLAGALVGIFAGWAATGSLWPDAAGRFVDPAGFGAHLGAALGLIGQRYPALLLNPVAMTADPACSIADLMHWSGTLAGAAFLAVAAFAAIRTRGRYPLVVVGIGLFAAGTLPALPFLNGDMPSQVSAFCATLCLPFLIASLLETKWTFFAARKWLILAPALLAMLSFTRSLTWQDQNMLIAVTPGPLRALDEAATALTTSSGASTGLDAAIAVLDRGLDRLGDDQRLLHFGFELEMSSLGRADRAQDYLERLERERPHHPALHSMRGRLAQKSGMEAEAVKHIEAGLAGAPWDPEVRWDAGVRFSRAGNNERAEVVWRQGLRLCVLRSHQDCAARILTQLRHLANAGTLSPGLFKELCRRQLRYVEPGSALARRFLALGGLE